MELRSTPKKKCSSPECRSEIDSLRMELQEWKEKFTNEVKSRLDCEKENKELKSEIVDLKADAKNNNRDKNDPDYKETPFDRSVSGSVIRYDPVVAKLGIEIMLTTNVSGANLTSILEIINRVLDPWPNARIPSSRYWIQLREGTADIITEQLKSFVSRSLSLSLFMDETPCKNANKVNNYY